jgi:glycosyltransferase involved in cell wall biosynthesis
MKLLENKPPLGIVGFPGLYGGAGVELDSQITLWHDMGLDLHVVPAMDADNEPLLRHTMARATVHPKQNYNKLAGMPVISFCNDVFLRDLKEIKKHAQKTIFVNCMTWLFDAEKKAHEEGLIDLFLYQTDLTQQKVSSDLLSINSHYNWKTFNSWFDDRKFHFWDDRQLDKFRFGRVSRSDADKYARDTLHVYETMVAPVPKSGVILGFDHKSEEKIGKPPDYIRAYQANGITQQEFYAHTACLIQKADTFENWPRIGMEAMASGSLLIVDNRGGWTKMIEHGKTGWLCNHDRDFIYYSSRMAYEPKEREIMALNARDKLNDLCGREASIKSWQEVLEIG